MKLLVGSKGFARGIKRLKDGDFQVEHIALNKDILTLIGYKTSIDVPVHTLNFEAALHPMGRHRWDWVYRVLNAVEEQPCVLIITDKKVQIIFEM